MLRRSREEGSQGPGSGREGEGGGMQAAAGGEVGNL
jgi:hypothetical protein